MPSDLGAIFIEAIRKYCFNRGADVFVQGPALVAQYRVISNLLRERMFKGEFNITCRRQLVDELGQLQILASSSIRLPASC